MMPGLRALQKEVLLVLGLGAKNVVIAKQQILGGQPEREYRSSP